MGLKDQFTHGTASQKNTFHSYRNLSLFRFNDPLGTRKQISRLEIGPRACAVVDAGRYVQV